MIDGPAMSSRWRTIEELRALVEAGVPDGELADRATRGESGLALCWCGFDMMEHRIDFLDDRDAQDWGWRR